ncbi:MAG: hypothetical protein AAGF90_10690 [Pseudomonadota bacterium]
MTAYAAGDLVVLISGSMRMAVERVEDDVVHCVWCNEGVIGRDRFSTKLLKKWEMREDGGHRGRGDDDRRPGSGKPYRGDRDGGGKPHRGGRDDRDGGGDRPRGKTGWDGKPREKKYFRKDD